ncbi:MAG: PAS domain S-box protein [Sphingomonadales bacterium]|mgnify:CR=1 FL=1|nr:PAS domain S-box protein [Sphingomonadales bacterium]
MRCPSSIDDEEGRQRALAEYGLSQERNLPSLDPIVEIAARMFNVPAAAVNMIGSDHVFLVANHGVDEDVDCSRDVSFCAHAITQDDVLVVEDARLDPRFHDNPIVTKGQICFYAGVPLVSPSGHALGALCIIDSSPRAGFSKQDQARLKDLGRLASDQLELRRLEVAAEAGPSHFEASAATSPNAVVCFDAASRITAWNAAAADMFGHDAEAVNGQPVDLLMVQDDRERVHAALTRVLAGAAPDTAPTELTGVRANGERFPAEIYWSRWYEGGQMHFGAIVRDMTVQKRERDALFHLANYDGLTGLPNRNLLYQRGGDALRAGEPIALILLDLDGFKDINDTLGHAAGDAVLQS